MKALTWVFAAASLVLLAAGVWLVWQELRYPIDSLLTDDFVSKLIAIELRSLARVTLGSALIISGWIGLAQSLRRAA